MPIEIDANFSLIEDTTAERRGDRAFVPRSPRATRTFQLRALSVSYPVTDATIFAGVKKLVGFAKVQSEVVSGTTRRWIERTLPDPYPVIEDADVNPDDYPGLFCYSVPRVVPMTYGIADTNGWPKHISPGGVWMTAHYEALPFFLREDADVLAQSGPLSNDTPSGATSKPDEGDALRRGWGTYSRFVLKDDQPASRTITLPGGMVLYADPDGYIAANTPVHQGVPWVQYKRSIKYTWFGVPISAIPDTTISLLSNNVNDAEFDGYPAGTLLYISTSIQRYQGPLFNWLADITHHMAFMPNYDKINLLNKYYGGWNSIPALVTTGLGARRVRMAKISADGNAPTGDNALFKPGDLTGLFRPPQE